MDNDTIFRKEFKDYSNSLTAGFLKMWKADGIVSTLRAQRDIMEDEVRLLAYLKNCLQMEGFRDMDIELIMGWLYDRKDLL